MQNSRQTPDFIDIVGIGDTSHGRQFTTRQGAGPARVTGFHVLIHANLLGNGMGDQANSIIAAMRASGVERLVFILSMGIYDEGPGTFGEWTNARLAQHLKPFRRSADAIEAPGFAYMIVRPAWMTNEDEVGDERTMRRAPFNGTVVSRRSVADLIANIIAAPDLHLHANLGVNKPHMDGDKPCISCSSFKRGGAASATAARRGGKSHLRLGRWQNGGFLKSIHNFA
ncbi:NAD(P)H-binding protein [Janthinobacterium sp. 13]|uniref:NAD(P)H-binding protein n=1 Tax=Janthinobacterium sp. 13 TaxID=2035211 RepID=UPI001C558BDD|nr:NAD(P)H-binding protein [Janthinobacterium sp. 13]